MAEELVEVHYDDVLRDSGEAVLLLIERGDPGGPSLEEWVPKSQLRDEDGDPDTAPEPYSGNGSLHIPRWLAEEKGLV